MATPAAILSVLLEANTSTASASLMSFQRRLQTTASIASNTSGAFTGMSVQLQSTAANVGKATGKTGDLNKNLQATATHASNADAKTAGLSRSLNTVSGHAEKARGSIASLGKTVLAAGGAFVAFEVAKSAIQGTVQLAEATVRLSAITGLDAKQASMWIEVMKVRGVQARAVSMSFITLSRNIRGAEEGSKTAAKAFHELGISQESLKGQATQEVLLRVADGLSHVSSASDRAAIAQQLFGRGAQGIIPVLAQGRAGVEGMLEAAQRYGAYLPKNVKLAEGAIVAQRNLNLAMDGLKISFTEAVLPMLVQGAQKLMAFIAQIRNGTGAGGQFARVVSSAFHTAKDAVQSVVGVFGGLGNTLKVLAGLWVAGKVLAFAGAIRNVAGAIGGIGVVLRASPIIAAVTAIGFLVNAFIRAGNSGRGAAMSAREVAAAWNATRIAAKNLRDADLNLAQAQVSQAQASQGQHTAQDALNEAIRTYGRNSPQAKQATLELRQASVDLRRANNDLTDATDATRKAQNDKRRSDERAATALGTTQKHVEALTNAQAKKIQSDQQEAIHLGQQIHQMVAAHAPAEALRKKQDELRQVVSRLAREQAGLNTNLKNMPKNVQAQVKVNVDFASNLRGAIGSMAAQLGLTTVSGVSKLTKNFPGHAKGAVVDAPTFLVGEEAPQWPEFVLATNPAYRNRNIGLWKAAARALGIPGFQYGGQSSRIVADVPPWTAQKASGWMGPKAVKWANALLAKMAPDSGRMGWLERLWDTAGGSSSMAQLMAAIAMAESGGSPTAHNASGASGLWQILGVPFPGNVFDPLTNARMAVAKLKSQGLRAWEAYTNGAYRRFLGGGGGGVGGAISAAGGGLGMFDGRSVASWIIPELQYARAHGWRGHITSGYRPGFDPMAPSGSMHALTRYPGGAVDFGGMIDAAGAANRAAFMQATAGYRGLRLIPPIGFRDDGHMSGTGHRRGGIVGRALPFAGSYAGGGTLPGPIGQPYMALLHGRETVIPAATGGILTKGQVPLAWLHKGHPFAGFSDVALTKAVMAQLAVLASQVLGHQIKMAGLQNAVTEATASGDTGGQKRALVAERALERGWLAQDKKRLGQINKALRSRKLTKGQRAALLQDKLAMLQEIGTVETDIGSITSSIDALDAASADTSGGGTSAADQAAADAQQARIDAETALTAALVAQKAALDALNQTLATQNGYMQSVAAIEVRQAIKALADVISGQIGGSYLSRSTGSAGVGTVASY